MTFRVRPFVLAMALAMSSFASAQVPISAEFTYQGELRVAGSPANANFDMEFRLYNAFSGGSQIGSAVTSLGVAVSNGLFTTQLDFGAAQFAGDAQWLEIRIKPSGSGAFEVLSPRTALSVSPYAWAARNALGNSVTGTSIVDGNVTSIDIADGSIAAFDLAAGAVNSSKIEDGTVGLADIDTDQVQGRVSGFCPAGSSIREVLANGSVTCETDDGGGGGGTVTSVATGAGLTGGPITTSGTLSIASGGVTSAMIADGTVTNADLAANSVNAGNIVDGTVGSAEINSAQVQTRVSGACVVGSAVRAINADGTVSCESDDIGWSLGGNLGTNPATNYIGTFDAQPFVIRTQNARSLRIEPSAEQFSGAPITTNIIAGSSANNVTSGVRGATIAGGGLPNGNSDPFFSAEAPNRVTDLFGTVGGGFGNLAGNDIGTLTDSRLATVGGGEGNIASDNWSTVGGGLTNLASGVTSIVAGGLRNTAAGSSSMVLGGDFNCAGGVGAMAGGFRAKVRVRAGVTAQEIGIGCAGVPNSGDADGDEGSFVWADLQIGDFVSSGPNQFLARADGGIGFNRDPGPNDDLVLKARAVAGDASADLRMYTRLEKTAAFQLEESSGSLRISVPSIVGSSPRLVVEGGSGGLATLTNGGSWTNASSRSFKAGFHAVDTLDVLARVVDLPITTWNYIGSAEGLHMGPVAEDFKAAFGLAGDGKSISTVDADGVALAAIQGLNQKLEAENAALRKEIEALRELVLTRVASQPAESDY